jgi:DNA-directed RNA polymerase II subunit RPB1
MGTRGGTIMFVQRMIVASGFVGILALSSIASAQIYVAPRVAQYAPAATTVVQSQPVAVVPVPAATTTYYAPAAATPVTTYYAPTPVTTYYTPSTAYYAPTSVYYSRATRSYYAGSAPVTTYYAPATTTYYAPTTAYYAPTTSYYAARTSYYAPTTSYYAPTTAYYGATAVAAPVVVGRPAVLGSGSLGQPKVYIPGQPIRNALRWATP